MKKVYNLIWVGVYGINLIFWTRAYYSAVDNEVTIAVLFLLPILFICIVGLAINLKQYLKA
jgi:ABC-type polysaccharide transport system permease subunit